MIPFEQAVAKIRVAAEVHRDKNGISGWNYVTTMNARRVSRKSWLQTVALRARYFYQVCMSTAACPMRDKACSVHLPGLGAEHFV